MEKIGLFTGVNLKQRAHEIKKDIMTLSYAFVHPGTPLLAKCLIFLVVAYALSPIDLIPDFIPVLGYLDDIILLPLGIVLALKMLPKQVKDECRDKAAMQCAIVGKPRRFTGAVIIITLWIVILLLAVKFSRGAIEALQPFF